MFTLSMDTGINFSLLLYLIVSVKKQEILIYLLTVFWLCYYHCISETCFRDLQGLHDGFNSFGYENS